MDGEELFRALRQRRIRATERLDGTVRARAYELGHSVVYEGDPAFDMYEWYERGAHHRLIAVPADDEEAAAR
jgi:hypothetical protein